MARLVRDTLTGPRPLPCTPVGAQPTRILLVGCVRPSAPVSLRPLCLHAPPFGGQRCGAGASHRVGLSSPWLGKQAAPPGFPAWGVVAGSGPGPGPRPTVWRPEWWQGVLGGRRAPLGGTWHRGAQEGLRPSPGSSHLFLDALPGCFLTSRGRQTVLLPGRCEGPSCSLCRHFLLELRASAGSPGPVSPREEGGPAPSCWAEVPGQPAGTQGPHQPSTGHPI